MYLMFWDAIHNTNWNHLSLQIIVTNMGSKQQKDDTVSKRTDATEMLHVPAAGDLEMAQTYAKAICRAPTLMGGIS